MRLDDVEVDKLQMFEVLTRVLKFVLDIEFEDSLRVVSDLPQGIELQEAVHCN